MGTLKTKLTRLEAVTHRIVPDQYRCSCCHGEALVMFPGEANGGGPRLPYDGAGGVCRLCRQPPPEIHEIRLAEVEHKVFAVIPWSRNPRLRFVEKLYLLMAIRIRSAKGSMLEKYQELMERHRVLPWEQQVERLFERNGREQTNETQPTSQAPGATG